MTDYPDNTMFNLSAKEYALLFKYDDIGEICKYAMGCVPCILYLSQSEKNYINLCPYLNPEKYGFSRRSKINRYSIYPEVLQFFKEHEGSFTIGELKSFIKATYTTKLQEAQ